MPRTADRRGLTLAAGLAVVLAASLAPAGLDGRGIPVFAWCVWGAVFLGALVLLRATGVPPAAALRRLVWMLPFVALLALPAGLLAAPGHRVEVTIALGARAVAALSAGVALAMRLGPAGFVAGMRALGVPERLADVLAASLASLNGMARQVQSMLRAREARRIARGPWPALLASPWETVIGFGRLTAALLLRSFERAEALDRARRARGSGEA